MLQMRAATLNVHYWTKGQKLNFDDLLTELDEHLSCMDIVCLQEVLYGQFLDEEVLLFSEIIKTTVKFANEVYSLPIDKSLDLEMQLRGYLGLPLDFRFSIEFEKNDIIVSSTEAILDYWMGEYESLPNTPLSVLEQHLNLPYMFFSGTQNPGFGNVILSRYPFQSLTSVALHGSSKHEYSTRVALSAFLDSPVPFEVICVHLDHISEDERLLELEQLLKAFPINNDYCEVLCGDLNSLLREDYNELELKALRETRQHADIEEPRFDVMKRLLDSGWVDCAWNSPRPCVLGNIKETCQYSVRIDYILCNQSICSCINSFRIFAMKETDHNMVFTVFFPVYKTAKYE